MSACAQTERVAEYALRALGATERSTFESHVRECEHCRADLDAMRPVVDKLVDWPTNVLRPTAPLWERLAQRIGATNTEPEARWADEPQWKEVAPGSGIFYKILASDAAHERVTLLVRLAPGAEYPPHEHAGLEELHLLEGELWIDDRKLYPGAYNRAVAGTGDKRVWSETGCTCVLITSPGDILK